MRTSAPTEYVTLHETLDVVVVAKWIAEKNGVA